MILYEKDKNYDNAFFDLNTSNTSFLEYANNLKDKGVKNWNFCLTILNKDLIGVNPHSETLDEKTIGAIFKEVWKNPWYYFREVVRIPSPIDTAGVPMQANKISIPMIWLYFNKTTSVIVSQRQTGKTVPAKAIFSYMMLMTYLHKGMIIAENKALANMSIDSINEYAKLLPYYITRYLPPITKLTDGYSSISIQPASVITAKYPPSDIKHIKNMCRGESLQSIFVDNATDIPYIDVVLENTIPCVVKIELFHSGVIITTRADEVSDKYPRMQWFYEHFIKDKLNWDDSFHDIESSEMLKTYMNDVSHIVVNESCSDIKFTNASMYVGKPTTIVNKNKG